MIIQSRFYHILILLLSVMAIKGFSQNNELKINNSEYFETAGLNVMLFHDTYPEGHQSGVTIIQNGLRVAANGDLRLESAPGQWQPVPKVGERQVDQASNKISVTCTYPDPEKDRKGFNPIVYPDFHLEYTVSVIAEDQTFRISVDLAQPISEEWVGKAGFNLELFPGCYFGKSYIMDDNAGLFPRQLNGPVLNDKNNGFINQVLAKGKQVTLAPESDELRMNIRSERNELELIDGRMHHNNGWYIVRSAIPAGATKKAVEWIVSPNVLPDWKYQSVIHVSQVGYLGAQPKVAIIEADRTDSSVVPVQLIKIDGDGKRKTILTGKANEWGMFYRYNYFTFDFTSITKDGLYLVKFGDQESNIFRIGNDIFDRHVWQPTLEYFLPVQMCHMRINDRYRVWHGLCHMDDALMAPKDTILFDGYRQGPSTMTKYKPYDSVPGLNSGGWHDAGDYDLRAESQAGTVRMLTYAYEEFGVKYDETTIDQENHLVELHRPDGKPDVLQQIEHGLLTIIGGYKNLGRLYRGIICSDLRQYVLLGDGSTMTDNEKYTGQNPAIEADDRWVFTEANLWHELNTAASLAASYRVMKDYNPQLAADALDISKELLANSKAEGRMVGLKVSVLVELILSTGDRQYKEELLALQPFDQRAFPFIGWQLGRVIDILDDVHFTSAIRKQIKTLYSDQKEICGKNPFSIPYEPKIWGAGWEIQRFGVGQYFLHKAFPDIVPTDYIYNALNFILGVHPGKNSTSFASGVGANSVEVAYGVNRADWSYIPGGVVSGTGLIRPDYFEFKKWPFFWQQTEYVIGGGGTDFMFLVLAAKSLAENNPK